MWLPKIKLSVCVCVCVYDGHARVHTFIQMYKTTATVLLTNVCSDQKHNCQISGVSESTVITILNSLNFRLCHFGLSK